MQKMPIGVNKKNHKIVKKVWLLRAKYATIMEIIRQGDFCGALPA